MKVLIIEDEPLVAKDLQNRIRNLDASVQVLDIIGSVEQARKWFSANAAPDLILSDIQLSDGISFDIFESMHIQCPVIFTTAYDEYAIRAFKINSIDYLLKPIDEDELKRAFVKYKSLGTENLVNDQLMTLLKNFGKDEKKYKTRFLTVQRNSLVPVLEDEIGAFHKEELIYIHTMANDRLLGEHQTLDEVESLLDPAKFYRVNRQYIIHIQTVARIKNTHKGLSVQLKPPFNIELDISREKATAFKKWMEG